MAPDASVVFTTHNRRDLLRAAIDAALAQTIPTEIIVMDDASDDGTEQMIRSNYKRVVYCRTAESRGPCYQRNRGIQMAQAEFVFPIDDDSILNSPRTLEQTLQEFSNARIAAVAIPFVNVLQDQVVRSKAPNRDRVYVSHAFVAASHAVRKGAFLEVGGYRESLFYMGEEGDLCIRLLERGYTVRLGSADPIQHHQPARRVCFRADYYGRRNDVLFVYANTPDTLLPVYLFGTTVKGVAFGIRARRLTSMLKGLVDGYRLAAFKGIERAPVGYDCFKQFRLLKRAGCLEIKGLEPYLSTRSVPRRPSPAPGTGRVRSVKPTPIS